MWELFTDGYDFKLTMLRLAVLKKQSLEAERKSWKKPESSHPAKKGQLTHRKQFTRAIGYR